MPFETWAIKVPSFEYNILFLGKCDKNECITTF
jgi:hypothetical protein